MRTLPLLLLLAPAAFAAPPALKVCVLEHEFMPRGHYRSEGPGQQLVRMAAAKQGRSVEFSPAPWKRCLSGVESQQYDAVIGVSDSPAFASFMRIPMRSGQADSGMAIAQAAHLAVRAINSAASWDGQHFTGLNGPVLYPSGAALVREKLTQLGAPGNDSAKTAAQVLGMLQRQRGSIAVLRKEDFEQQQKNAEFAGHFEALPQPFLIAYAYLGVLKSLLDAEPAMVQTLWRDIAGIRHSKEWARAEHSTSTRAMASGR